MDSAKEIAELQKKNGILFTAVINKENEIKELKKQLARYKGEVEELGRMLDDK